LVNALNNTLFASSGVIRLGSDNSGKEEKTTMAKIAKKKTKPVRKAKPRVMAAKRSGSARRKPAVKSRRPAARKAQRRKAA
jgi:hypothetical protein